MSKVSVRPAAWNRLVKMIWLALAFSTSAWAQSNTYTHDALDRLTHSNWASGQDSSNSVNTTYDAAGNVRTLVRTGSGLDGWVRSGLNGRLYRRLSNCGNWEQCRSLAESLQAQLPSIRNAEENAWLAFTYTVKHIPGGLWIGMNDKAQEGQFVWAAGDPVTYLNWAPGEPNNVCQGDEDEVHMYTDALWYDLAAGCPLVSNAVAGRAAGPRDRAPVLMPAGLASKLEHTGVHLADDCAYGLVFNSPPDQAAANAVELTFQMPAAGRYRLQVQYTAALSRPMDVRVNGMAFATGRLAATTGSWCAQQAIWETIGEHNLPAGPAMARLERGIVMPHVKAV